MTSMERARLPTTSPYWTKGGCWLLVRPRSWTRNKTTDCSNSYRRFHEESECPRGDFCYRRCHPLWRWPVSHRQSAQSVSPSCCFLHQFPECDWPDQRREGKGGWYGRGRNRKHPDSFEPEAEISPENECRRSAPRLDPRRFSGHGRDGR